ncbi:MAG: SIMPL domain-containing protein [Desulfuromonadaceae bacterium]|nr:SIMPL domain-containing protein [Desulfuromonadaceae bacterium]
MKFINQLIAGLLLLGSTVPVYAADVPQLTVRGAATIAVPADRTLIELAVETGADNAKQAIEENSEIMIRIISVLEELGLAEDEFATGQLQLQPQWNYSTQEGAPAEIIGYRASNRVSVRTTHQSVIGQLIVAATDAGANTLGQLSFDLSKPRKYRSEAIVKATENAFSDARALAAAADMRIVRVAELRLDDALPPRPVMLAAEVFSANRSAPPIKPGDVSLHAAVTLVCEIAPNR